MIVIARLIYLKRKNAREEEFVVPDITEPGNITDIEKSVIQNLDQTAPPLNYDRIQTSGIETCAVCLDDFSTEDVVRKLMCGHIFHLNCINVWSKQNTTCCLCKHNFTHQDNEFLNSTTIAYQNQTPNLMNISFSRSSIMEVQLREFTEIPLNLMNELI